MPDTSVKYFSSEQAGAPDLLGQIGGLLAVLDACLVNGFGSVTLDSLVVASEIATATYSAGHGFSMYGSTGPVIRIAGAIPSELNGDWRIDSADTTTFSFACPGVADGAASGTISAKRTPLGWTKPFAESDRAVYARSALEATAMVLRVRDDHADDVFLTMYESMSDVDTGTAPSTDVDDIWANHELAGPADWAMYGDDLCFYFLNRNQASHWVSAFFFGDIRTFHQADSYHAALMGLPSPSATNGITLSRFGNSQATAIARASTQIGGPVAVMRHGNGIQAQYSGNAGLAFPNPASNGLLVSPITVMEDVTQKSIRGTMPGCYQPLHNFAEMTDRAVFEGVSGLEGRTLLAQEVAHWIGVDGFVFDITGPWR